MQRLSDAERREVRRFRAAVLEGLITPEALLALKPEQVARIKRWRKLWAYLARDNQLEPDGAWRFWLVLAGRGFGKTRTAAEWMHERAASGRMRYGAIVGRSTADVRDVMVRGPSGILATQKPDNPCTYNEGSRKITWANGATALCYSAEEPDQLRGPEFDTVWGDELAAWFYCEEAFSNLDFGLRRSDGLGGEPKGIFTTTPRPVKVIKELIRSAVCKVVRGSTYENAANLPATAMQTLRDKYEGTRIGRQELYAEVLEDTDGANWTLQMVEDARRKFKESGDSKECIRIVVGVDPAGSATEKSDDTGIVVCGETHKGDYIVLEDLSCRMSPTGWASRAIDAYNRWQADVIVAEKNFGGDMVEAMIHTVDRRVNVNVVTASKSKMARAEPIAALYEQNKVAHAGDMMQLEEQLTTFTGARGDKSPDRHDALVWAMTELLDKQPPKVEFVWV